MSTQIDKIVRIYRNLAQIPSITGAKLLSKGTIIHSVWSQRNLERGKTMKLLQEQHIDGSLNKVATGMILDVSQELISAISPSEKLRALIREIAESKENRKQMLEVWNNQNLIHSVDLTELDLHGDVYTDGEFGTLQWSPDESKILYIAEKKQPTAEPFYKQKKLKSSSNNESETVVKGGQHVYKQDWGEQMVGKVQTVVVTFDLATEDVKIMEGIPSGVCPAKVQWSPIDAFVIGIAYFTDYRKLGLIYCTNRLSTIFSLDFNGNYVELLLENKAVKSPKFTPDGKFVVWLQRPAGGPHHGCMELVKSKLPLQENTKPDIVIPIVDTAIKTANDKPFFGLYNTGYPSRCWAKDNRRMIMSTPQNNSVCTYIINIDNGNIIELLDNSAGSLIALDIHDDLIVANRRNYFASDTLLVAVLPSDNKYVIAWRELTTPVPIQGLENYEYHYINLKHDDKSDNSSVQTFSAIYLGPKNAPVHEVPLVLWPHGGPHSAFVNCMALETTLYALHGFAMLMVNYRGSIGAGQKSVESLLGRVGTADVADCILAVDTVVEKFPCINPNKLALTGGSHGGFLVTHLSGQYPDKFKCVVSRNPVIDIASMSILSDIPDWCYVEAGLEYTQKGHCNDVILQAMRKASPIEHAHRVKAPTLLQIGSKDLRVPPAQGIEYYHRLKANGVTVKMNLYDDNHPLGSVPNEMDNCINGLLWIQQYTN